MYKNYFKKLSWTECLWGNTHVHASTNRTTSTLGPKMLYDTVNGTTTDGTQIMAGLEYTSTQ